MVKLFPYLLIAFMAAVMTPSIGVGDDTFYRLYCEPPQYRSFVERDMTIDRNGLVIYRSGEYQTPKGAKCSVTVYESTVKEKYNG